ncbi:MAG: DUF3747 domain-containing protein [Cyanobacteria bacterium P01_C01_bin.120]
MKLKKALQSLAVATAVTVGMLGGTMPARTTTFGAAELDQNSFLSVAIPAGSLVPYKLWLIRENQPGANCWGLSGNGPTIVDPVWRNNVGPCGTTSDTNGYSIRVGGEELRTRYVLTVQESNGELLLLGKPLIGKPFVIGRTGGVSTQGFMQIQLEPGWRITQRTFDGQRLSHFYYTNDLTLAQLLDGEEIVTGPTPTPDPRPQPDYPFPDIARVPYADEIAAAFNLGLVAGGTDGRYDPLRPVTREEAASIVAEAILTKGFTFSETVSTAPFPDVAANRWSAAKIAALRNRGVLAGDPSGFFRPTDTVTRAELMSMLRRASEQIVAAGSEDVRAPELTPTGEVFNFTDTAGHWNQQTIATMSAYCGVATPYNERGTAFRPDAQSLRDYTAAATFRMIDCGATPLP